MMLSLCVAAVLSASASDPIVAVLYFDNNSNDRALDVMRKGLADLVVTDLVAWNGVRVVERNRLEDTLAELKLQQTKAFDAATRVKVGKLLGAQYLLSGAFYLKGDKLLIDATLTHSASAEKTPVSVRVEGLKDTIFDLEQQLVEKLAQQIDLKVKDVKGRKRAKVSTLEALLTYSAGVDLADQGKFDEAEKAFTKAISSSPTFMLARERKEGLKAFIEQARAKRKEAITDGVLAVATQCDEGLKADFSTLDQAAASTFLLWRTLKGRVLARRLKAELTPARLVRRGREKQALELMRAWATNAEASAQEHRLFVDRFSQTLVTGQRIEASPRVEDPSLAAQAFDAQLMTNLEVERDPVRAFESFVLEGRLTDGESFSVAPALADFEPKRYEALMPVLRARVDSAPEMQAVEAAELLVDTHLKLDQYEAAASVLQKMLDRFPTSARFEGFEKRLRSIADESCQAFDGRRRFAWVLKSCRVERAMSVQVEWQPRFGLQSVDRLVEQSEQCAGAPWAQSAFESLYSSAADFYRGQRDCERAAFFTRKALGAGAWPETQAALTTRDGCDAAALELKPMPARVRITLTSGGMNWEQGQAFKTGLEALLAEDIGAHGFNLENGGASHGGTVSMHVSAERDRRSGAITLMGHRSERLPDVAELPFQSVVQREVKGSFNLSAYADALLVGVVPGFVAGDRKRISVLPKDVIVAVGQALELFEDRKYAESEKAFAALRKTAAVAAFAARYERFVHLHAIGETQEW